MKEDRLAALALIDEAKASGAREGAACRVMGLSARTVERWRVQGETGEDRRCGPLQRPKNALSDAERARVVDTANLPAYRNLSPNQIVPKLADAGEYVCSESTMYRILRAEDQMTHRQPSAPAQKRPRSHHVATEPNEVYSWDITYLKTTIRGLYFYLYMAIDIWSRKIIGWEVHAEESMELGASFVDETCRQMHVDPKGIVWHSDNGGPMKGSTMLAKLQQLGLIPSFSRPSVSDDNPFSEALFRTLKYRPDFPTKPFQNLQEARAWVAQFVRWYNSDHLHSGIRFITPNDRHEGRENEILKLRRAVYERARQQNPERWINHKSRNWEPVVTVFLNPEKREPFLFKETLAA
jgi:transposase InsO family protein